MERTATVNYHVHKPERQAFELDAGGIAGNLISPELAPTEVRLSDVRNGAAVSFAADSVAFTTYPSAVADFGADRTWQSTYDAELTDLLTSTLGAREVIIFDHTVRVDDPEAVRKPARNVHSDYSVDGANQRLIDLIGADAARDWQVGHFAFINVWRPVDAPINSSPLGFVRPSSLNPEDWVLLDLIYPDRTGQIMGLVGNAGHEWLYQSKMTPDDVVFFNIYDNRGRPSIAHSALDMVEDPSVNSVRKSIESRTLIRYASGDA
ncbi:MAG: CmcJ/NvfI family oxidoreductase [Pseudomonadota bacterium]